MKLVNPNIYGRKYATSVQNLERVSNVCRSDPSRGFHLGFLYLSATVRRNGNRATNVIFFFLPSEKMCIKKHRPASLASPSKHWWRNGGKVRGRSGNWSFWKRRGRRVSGLPYVRAFVVRWALRESRSVSKIHERNEWPSSGSIFILFRFLFHNGRARKIRIIIYNDHIFFPLISRSRVRPSMDNKFN